MVKNTINNKMVKIFKNKNNETRFDVSKEVNEFNKFIFETEQKIKKGVKFLKKGLRVDGKYYSVHYSIGNYTKESGISKDTITIYHNNCNHLPEIAGLNNINESDIMTDYFEKDRIRVTSDNIWYNDILKVMQ